MRDALSLSTCFEVDRFANIGSAGIGMVTAFAVGVAGVVLGSLRLGPEGEGRGQ